MSAPDVIGRGIAPGALRLPSLRMLPVGMGLRGALCFRPADAADVIGRGIGGIAPGALRLPGLRMFLRVLPVWVGLRERCASGPRVLRCVGRIKRP